MSGDDDFLSRWSRRKRAPDTDQEADGAEPVAPGRDGADIAVDNRTDDEILAELGLKHPDTLQTGDDIKGFMQAAVPDRLRRIAVRQLFRSRPELAVLDGLVDYGEDFTDVATVIGDLQTTYRVGKGMLTDEEIAAREEKHRVQEMGADADDASASAPDHDRDGEAEDPVSEEKALEADEPVVSDHDSDTVAVADVDRIEVGTPLQSSIEAEAETEANGDPEDTGPTRRRMAFKFGRT